MFIFKHNFNSQDLEIESSKEVDALFRQAYFGGRCEVFGNTTSPEDHIVHYDFTSMYGQVMNEAFPVGPFNREERDLTLSNPGFYFATLNSINILIPVLPHRVKEEGLCAEFTQPRGVIFPNGEFEGLYWHEELELFTKQGGIIQALHWGYVFKDKPAYCFQDFSSHCMKQRNLSNFNKKL